jgi:intein/homing endonuclease
MIVGIDKSPLAAKRYRVTMDNGNTYDFGLKTGYTYTDGAGIYVRDNYRKRHLANKTEQRLIENLVPSPSLFAYYLLWGPHTSLKQNIKYLNSQWAKKHLG